MKKALVLAISLLPWFATAQQAVVVKFPYVGALMEAQQDTTYVINFWATWCKPCINELPAFLEFEEATRDQKVRLVLVSLDFVDQFESKLIPFLNKWHISSRVVLLDEMDYDAWISRVHPDWEGAIPATLVVNKKRGLNAFYEGELDKESLFRLVSGQPPADNDN